VVCVYYYPLFSLPLADSLKIDDNAREHMPSQSVVLAVLGSLQLVFTRLVQITGNDKYFDAVQGVMNELEKWQDNTILPGMWPAMVDSTKYNQSCLLGSPYVGVEETFTLGSLADSAYEYLPKAASYLDSASRLTKIAIHDAWRTNEIL
jgi:hypothetical protein